MTQEFTKQPVEVEEARPEDAAEVFDVQRRTWLDTYPNEKAGVTYDDLKLRLDGENGELIPQKVERWKQGIESTGDRRATFVVRDNGKIVGFVAPGIMNEQRRIGAIYVLPEAQGKGIGNALLKKSIEWHGRDDDIYLHVATYNQNAIDFYKRNGFMETGTKIEDDGTPQIPEIEMVLKAENSKELGLKKNLTLRPATNEDTEFARIAHHEAYRDVIERQFGSFDETAQDEFFFKSWSGNAGFQIINWGGQPAGYTRVEETPEYIYGHELVLLPEHQSKGIGSFLLNSWQENAKSKNIPLKLQVLKDNKAKELYERVGFVETGQTDTHYEMEWSPNS